MEYITLSHVALNCSDYETSLKFYRDILGLKQKFSLYGSDGSLWLTYMEASPGVFVELFPSNGRPINKYNPKTATALHFCLLVDDIEEAARDLQAKGIDIYAGPKHAGNKYPVPFEKLMGKAGEYSFYISDPDDNPVEIMQYVEPTTLMTMTDEQIAALQDKLKTDTYIVQPEDHPVVKYLKQRREGK